MTSRPEALRVAGRGALLGAAAWIAYGTVEYFLWSLMPRIERSYCSGSPLEWSQDLAAILLYPIVGALVGSLAALLHLMRAGHPDRPSHSTAGPFVIAASVACLALASAAGVVAQLDIRGSARAMFMAAMGVATGLTVTALVNRFNKPISSLTNPWLVSVVLLGLPAFASRAWTGDARVPIYLGALLYLVTLTALVALNLRRERMSDRVTDQAHDDGPSPAGRLLRATLACAAVVAVGWTADRSGYLYAPGLEAAPPTSTRPNVIVLVMDTARAENLSLYGYDRDTTPNLRRFAQSATVYTRATSASNYTLSSHASLFTGLLPSSHGAYPGDPTRHVPVAAGGYGLADRFVTLAEMLKSRSYFTAAVISNYGFASEGYNLDQGFHRFVVQSHRCVAPAPSSFLRFVADRWTTGAGVTWQPPPYDSAARINRDVGALLDRIGRNGQRFFLFVNYMDVHWPYAPPPPFDTLFPGKDATFDRSGYVDLRNAVLRGERKVTSKERNHLLSQYDGGLAFLDEEMGKLLHRLARRTDYDDSLIIVTADHGEAFGDKGFVEHGTSVYDDQIRVPLIIKYPRSREARVVRDPVSLIDILPTVVDLLDTEAPRGTEGRSLVATSNQALRPVIAESFPRTVFRRLGPRGDRVQRAIVAGPLKLISSSTGERELYDLDRDPHETTDLYRPDNRAAIELQKSLDAWLTSLAASDQGAPVTDPETLERLRSLGYIK